MNKVEHSRISIFKTKIKWQKLWPNKEHENDSDSYIELKTLLYFLCFKKKNNF